MACLGIAAGIKIPVVNDEIYSILFGLIIINFAANDKIVLSLENRFFNYLGSISYGLYMFHPICIVAALHCSTYLGFDSNWFVYPLTLSVTIVMASLSFKYFESFFVKLKGRFSRITSS